ncbi:hypothetical protein BC941DRAFT_442871 [Chlamydoabsidia padenii]|nr:hypothetical protein BC941DRAFT_442871 [Chlamydoabsidia padenii]
MTTEADFQEKLQRGYTLLASNLKELYDKEQEELENAMTNVSISSVNNLQDDFDGAKLQDNMQKLCMIISHDATKLTLACKPPRKPEEAIKMIDAISNTIYRLVGFYYDIPSSCKVSQTLDIATYRKAYQNITDGILRGALSLFVSFMDPEKVPTSTSSTPFMLSTAALWETCKSASSLPANNKEAVSNEWKSLIETLVDAKNETEDMKLSSNNENSDHLDSGIAAVDDDNLFDDDMDLDVEVDTEVARKCTSLVGLTCLLFQKIQKRCIFTDVLVIEGRDIVEQVDIMVSKAYDLEPNDMTPVMENYVEKVNSLIRIAHTSSSQENDAVWFKMCATKLSGILA